MNWEIYETTGGHKRVNIAGQSYALTLINGGSELEPRQYAQARAGDYGMVVRAYAEAAESIGIVPRFAWEGIINALGDHASVSPPHNPKEADYNRIP